MSQDPAAGDERLTPEQIATIRTHEPARHGRIVSTLLQDAKNRVTPDRHESGAANDRPIIIRLREILSSELEAKASCELVPSHEDATALAAAIGVHCMYDRPNALYVFRRTRFAAGELGDNREVLR